MFFHHGAHRLAKGFSPVLNRRAATAIVEERGRQSMTHVIYSLLRRSLAGSQRTAEPKPKYRKAFFIFFHRVHPRASKGHWKSSDALPTYRLASLSRVCLVTPPGNDKSPGPAAPNGRGSFVWGMAGHSAPTCRSA